MKEKKKKEWLGAIRKLREHYKKYPSNETPPYYSEIYTELCPFCVVSNHVNCKDCLWIKFEGDTCDMSFFWNDATAQRLDRLDRWENNLKRETK